MKKYKPKMVRFLFSRKQYQNSQWHEATPVDYRFGNRHTDEVNEYQFNGNYIGMIFSDELAGDPRRWNKKAKFTINEATILLLKYLEDRLKKANNEKRRLDRIEIKISKYQNNTEMEEMESFGYEYARKINNRELTHTKNAVKIYRKKVKEIKQSKEYLWELMLK